MIECCGVRRHLHNIDENVINVCPCCEEPDETTSHILLCEDKDRTTLFKKSVRGLMNWMVKEGTSPQIIKMVGDYLRARNTKTMVELYDGPKTNDLKGTGWKLAQEHDQLGWQNFAEGRISKLYIDIQHRWYKREKNISVERQSKHGQQASLKIWYESHTTNGLGEMRNYTSDDIQELKQYLNMKKPCSESWTI